MTYLNYINSRRYSVTYIIAEPCIDLKDGACIDACPVDCIALQQTIDEDCNNIAVWIGHILPLAVHVVGAEYGVVKLMNNR